MQHVTKLQLNAIDVEETAPVRFPDPFDESMQGTASHHTSSFSTLDAVDVAIGRLPFVTPGDDIPHTFGAANVRSGEPSSGAPTHGSSLIFGTAGTYHESSSSTMHGGSLHDSFGVTDSYHGEPSFRALGRSVQRASTIVKSPRGKAYACGIEIPSWVTAMRCLPFCPSLL
jgi:hypothetical protein